MSNGSSILIELPRLGGAAGPSASCSRAPSGKDVDSMLDLAENDDADSPTASRNASRSPSPRRRSFLSDDDDDVAASIAAASLAPIDGGSQAWTFLAAAFVTEMVCLGGAFSFSIFQDYLVQSPHSPLHKNGTANNVSVSAIGTLLVCSSYFAPAVLRGVWSRFAKHNRAMGFASLQLAGLSLLAASFGQSVAFLLVFMGVLPGILLGLGTLNYLIWLPQWFLLRRGLANGIAFAGAGTGGILYPFILDASLRSVGFAWTLRIWAAIIVMVGGLSSLLLRPRIAPRSRVPASALPMRPITHRDDESQQSSSHRAPIDRPKDGKHPLHTFKRWLHSIRFLASPLLLSNALATFMASMSFFSVSFYLAVYCASLGFDSGTSTGLVAAFNAAALTGEIIVGHACDRFAYPSIIFLIATVGSLSAFLLFGLAHSLIGVVFFVLLFGMAAGSYCSVWTPAAYDVSRLHNMQTANVLLSLTVPRGLAAAIGPLIAAALYHPQDNAAKAIFGTYGFGALIAFVGSCMVALLPIAPLIAYCRRKALSDADPATLHERL